ncbi:MAG: beta-lactamase family protein [Caldilineaceae bacterium]|nr:beta-lactamase family protein [Caldilineaceae bacterium]
MHTTVRLGIYEVKTEGKERKHIPGLSLAVIQDGVTVGEKNYGLANVELSVPVTSATIYEIASMTKGFTAAAILLLVAEGKLRAEQMMDNNSAIQS